jgi:hypothetical protein
MTRPLAVLAVLAAAFLAGCGGGARSVPAPGPGLASAQKATLTLRLNVPTTTTAAKKRVPRYISPATTRISIDVEQNGSSISGYPTTAPLTPTSTGCSSTLASTICTFSLPLAASGTPYAVSVSMLDANNTVLSQTLNVPVTIVAGQANTIDMSLGGLATGASVLPYLTHRMVLAAGGVSVYGNAAIAFEVVPTDADLIVGVGAPAPTVTLASGGHASLTAPTSANPNLWTITPNYQASDPTVPTTDALQITVAPVASSGGSTVNASANLAIYQPWIYLLDGTTNAIDVFDEQGNAIGSVSAFSGGALTYLGYAMSIAFGDNAIYAMAGYANNGYLSKYALTGGAPTRTVTQATSGFSELGSAIYAFGLAFDLHNGQLYTGDQGSSRVAAAYDPELAIGSSAAVNISAPTYGVAYVPLTHQLVYNGAYGGSVLCSEALVCSAIGSNLNDIGIAWDPIDGVFGVNIATCCGTNGGIQTSDLSGTHQTVLVSNGLNGGAIAYDPYAAVWLWAESSSCKSPSRCRVYFYDSSGNDVTPAGGFAIPSNHQISGFAVVP